MESLIEIDNSKKTRSVESLAGEYPVLAKYLESSRKIYERTEIPLSTAEYDEENKELVIEMEIPEWAQAWEGFSHGGYLAILLDTSAGVAGFMEAMKLGKGIVTKEIKNIDYKLPIRIDSLVKVRGKILSISDNVVSVQGTISLITDGKERRPFVFCTAEMVIKDMT